MNPNLSFGPNWAPLREKLGDDKCSDFMFMASHTHEGITIHFYKNRDNKAYYMLDEDGQCYRWINRTVFEKITDEEACSHVYEGGWK